MSNESFRIHTGEGPFVAAAIHSGHLIRPELNPLFNLTESERLREEDPYTDWLTNVAPNRIIGLKSRFEVDLNRKRNKAVYLTPEDAWGLKVWKNKPEEEVVNRSLEIYDAFFEEVKKFLSSIIDNHGYVVVYDLHSYNYRRDGSERPPADPEGNPDINLGTANLNREVWGPVVDGLANDLHSFGFPGGPLDVRENIRFFGGHFSRRIQQEFGDRSCVIAIEFKKFFMDEWSGTFDRLQLTAIRNALLKSVPGMLTRSRKIAGKSDFKIQ